MGIVRVVVTGSVGAGKSTFVRTVSETEVVEIERFATDEASLLKEKTTVAFDFGQVAFGSHNDLHIYGTPGQSRFDFMWDILIRDAHAYILLVAADQPSRFSRACEILSFMNQRVQIPMIIAITRSDCFGAKAPEEIMMRLGYKNDKNRPPVVMVNPQERTSIVKALVVLMDLLIRSSNT